MGATATRAWRSHTQCWPHAKRPMTARRTGSASAPRRSAASTLVDSTMVELITLELSHSTCPRTRPLVTWPSASGPAGEAMAVPCRDEGAAPTKGRLGDLHPRNCPRTFSRQDASGSPEGDALVARRGLAASNERDYDLCGISVEVLSASVINRGRPRICVSGSDLHVTQGNASVERRHDEPSPEHVGMDGSQAGPLAD